MQTANKQVILIMVDTQRTDMVGCYGGHLSTPCIDSLAAEGVLFEKAYTTQPVCGPARSALFTGLFPHSNGCWANSIAPSDNVKTIGQRLAAHGVPAAYVGKWHLDGGDYFGLGRCPDGWDPDYWYDMRCYLEELTVEERRLSRRYKTMEETAFDESFTYGHRCTNRAIDYVQKHRGEDYLLVLSYDEPHGPSLCPKPWSEMYKDFLFPAGANSKDTLENKPEHQRVWAAQQGASPQRNGYHQYFFGCNSFVDSEIGRMLDAVRTHAPDALVIYTSDHGDFLDAHRLSQKGPATYDEIAKIPFLVKGPGIPAGARCKTPMSHIDAVPTMLEWFGLPAPRWADGVSALDVFQTPEQPRRKNVFVEFGRYEIDHDGYGGFQPLRCIFDGRYKLTVNLLCTDELYDLENDPGEMDNLINNEDTASLRNGLHDALLGWMNDTRDPFRGYCWQRRPWRTDAPAASWDYTGCTRQRCHEEFEPTQLDYGTGLEITSPVRRL